MQQIFESLRTHNFVQSATHLWIFKKSTSARKYTAHYVPTDEELATLLKNLVLAEMTRITEWTQYSYLAQTNENNCLIASQQGTDFHFLQTQVDRPEPECRADGIKDLTGAEGYVVKFVFGGETVYAVKRVSSSWKTSYSKKFINIVFSGGQLSAAQNNGFSIERNFDFFCKGGLIFIANKRNFESAMGYRQAYVQAFATLQQNPTFSGLFTDLQPLVDYIGNNSIQLRRMAVVEQKGVFSKPNLLADLQRVSASRNWGINFEAGTNKIIPCDLSSKVILQVLLDHRLMSEITQIVYDVPDATQI